MKKFGESLEIQIHKCTNKIDFIFCKPRLYIFTEVFEFIYAVQLKSHQKRWIVDLNETFSSCEDGPYFLLILIQLFRLMNQYIGISGKKKLNLSMEFKKLRNKKFVHIKTFDDKLDQHLVHSLGTLLNFIYS